MQMEVQRCSRASDFENFLLIVPINAFILSNFTLTKIFMESFQHSTTEENWFKSAVYMQDFFDVTLFTLLSNLINLYG